MTKKQKILLLVLLLCTILLMMILLRQKNHQKNIMPTPTPTPQKEIEQLNAFPEEDSGLTKEEVESLDQIARLKQLSPIATPNFSIEYSYKTAGFVVKSAQSLSATEKNLKIWLNENGFGDIPDSRFEYQSSKLAL